MASLEVVKSKLKQKSLKLGSSILQFDLVVVIVKCFHVLSFAKVLLVNFIFFPLMLNKSM